MIDFSLDCAQASISGGAHSDIASIDHHSQEPERGSVVAILPAFNEETSIGSVVLLTRMYVDRVIVVDDGSSDRTAEVARLAGAEVIRHPTNMGKGAALRTGFMAAEGADVIGPLEKAGCSLEAVDVQRSQDRRCSSSIQ